MTPVRRRVAIILAGTHVWNEDSFESLCPRVVVPIANAPLLSYTLAWLRDGGVRGVVICANEGLELFRRWLRDGGYDGCDVRYFVDAVPRGPAGCCRDAAQVHPADEYLVIEGSVIPRIDLAALLAFHEGTGASATVVIERHDGDDSTDPHPAGIYVLSRAALLATPSTGFQDLKEMLIPRLHSGQRGVRSYESQSSSPRVVGGVGSYFAVQEWALARLAAGELICGDYRGHRGLWCHTTACVSRDVRAVGPVMVGPATVVSDGAILVGPTVIGEGCIVGENSVIAQSILWERCLLSSGVRLERCVLASGAALARGVSLSGAIWRRSDGTRAPRVSSAAGLARAGA
jgi:NDP-sugar pyrophosphorylase family protein